MYLDSKTPLPFKQDPWWLWIRGSKRFYVVTDPPETTTCGVCKAPWVKHTLYRGRHEWQVDSYYEHQTREQAEACDYVRGLSKGAVGG